MIETIFLLAIIFSSGIFAISALLAGQILWGIIPVATGIFWLIAQSKNWYWSHPLAVLLISVGSAGGLWLGLSPLAGILSSIFALIAWDLHIFRNRMQSAAEDDELAPIERAHLERLSLFAVIAGTIGIGTLIVQLSITFWGMIFLVFIGVIGLILLLRGLRQAASPRKTE